MTSPKDMTPKEKARDARLKRTYGLSLAQWNQILEYQGGICPICERPPKPGETFVTEHDHSSKQVRGITCNWCNLRIIGKRRDGDRLRRAADYLDDPPAQHVFPGHKVPTKKRPVKRSRKK